jgi:hypothetical protein
VSLLPNIPLTKIIAGFWIFNIYKVSYLGLHQLPLETRHDIPKAFLGKRHKDPLIHQNLPCFTFRVNHTFHPWYLVYIRFWSIKFKKFGLGPWKFKKGTIWSLHLFFCLCETGCWGTRFLRDQIEPTTYLRYQNQTNPYLNEQNQTDPINKGIDPVLKFQGPNPNLLNLKDQNQTYPNFRDQKYNLPLHLLTWKNLYNLENCHSTRNKKVVG